MPCPHAEQRVRLAALIAHDDIDAAIEAGLMQYTPCTAPCCAHVDDRIVLAKQTQLRKAWAARERYRARAARLQRRADERNARRQPAVTEAARPSLPSAAAAILARAKAKAAQRSSGNDPA